MAQYDIFERFSETAREVLKKSESIAKSMNSGIESQHLLLSLSVTPGSLAFDILREHMISIDQIRLVLRLEGFQSKTSSGMSTEVKRILHLASQKAVEFHHYTIESEHLLLGLVS